ncbi:MAG: Isoprenylcysteine carboxyl methyltransferase family-domain-containing protein [Monoraphidium minutum]|nr:MAG: Isoprenylcysteine carboxyl methyltransferase family-domain-containing protein [Monoraphidium minutum]
MAAAAAAVWWQLPAFGAALAFFHTSEFLIAAVTDRENLSSRSFLFSKPYAIAMGCGLSEFFLERWLAPGAKARLAERLSLAGLALLLLGEALRKTAMLTARAAFTHDIQLERRPQHQLVTGGVYRYIRHPGYLGWFIWAVAGQLLLANPLSAAAFAYVSLRFFRERISFEEAMLQRMFGPRYTEYARRTPTWFPGIP